MHYIPEHMTYSPKRELMLRISVAAVVASTLAFVCPALAAEPAVSSSQTTTEAASAESDSVGVESTSASGTVQEETKSTASTTAETTKDSTASSENEMGGDKAPASAIPTSKSSAASTATFGSDQQAAEEMEKKDRIAESSHSAATEEEAMDVSAQSSSEIAASSNSATAVRHAALLASTETEEKTVLDGIDISNYQRGIDVANISADFVIVKATEGTTYLSPQFKTQADAVLSSGKLLGIYHFARTGSTALEQAEYFVKYIKDYLGKAVLFLDWENTSSSDIEAEGTGWCKQWLDAVYEMTGVRPIIYMSKNSVLTHDFSNIASDYGLWGAQYADMSRHDGYQEDPWVSSSDYGSWKSGPALFQYSNTTYLSGWDGALDVDKFYGTKEAWMKYAAQ